MNKLCNTCKVVKHFDEFSMNYGRTGLSSRLHECKSCRSEKKKLTRERSNLLWKERMRADPVAWAAYLVSKNKYKLENPIKVRARHIAQNEIRTGRILRLPCEVCGALKTNAHHDDYAKPKEVRFLCHVHHGEWHRLHGEAPNGREAPVQPLDAGQVHGGEEGAHS